MWHFRRRRRDLTPEDEDELYELFARVPDLELPYCFREDIAEIFDTAKTRKAAAARLEELREVVADEPELLEFFAFYDRWRDGILAFFDRRETSAAVEDLKQQGPGDHASQLWSEIGRKPVAAISARGEPPRRRRASRRLRIARPRPRHPGQIHRVLHLKTEEP